MAQPSQAHLAWSPANPLDSSASRRSYDVLVMRHHIGPVTNVRAAVSAGRLLGFFCRWCGHASRFTKLFVYFARLERRLCDQ
jgi:hypothetical protein